MTTDSNKVVIRRFIQLLNGAHGIRAADIVSPSALFRIPGEPEARLGPNGCLAIIHLLRSGFPDIQWTLHDMIGEEDKVAVRVSMRGTHRASFLHVPATGKTIAFHSIGFYRLTGGQLLEEYVQPDLGALLQQITPTRRYGRPSGAASARLGLAALKEFTLRSLS
jgi:predicted ester cyclase